MANTPSTRSRRTYCSELNPNEPLAGTADTVDVWLLLEYRPAWKPRALSDNALSAEIRGWLKESIAGIEAAGYKVRPQFIRQPEFEGETIRFLLAHGGRTFLLSGAGYEFLLSVDPAALIAAPEAAGAVELTEPQYLVCTNGQRDVCCARYGLPVYAALRERVGERAWQTTHLGGHRFAPNVLTLPDARLYGRVAPETVAEFVDRVESGRVDFSRLRGCTAYPPVAQAAEAALGRDGLTLLAVEGTDAEAVVRFEDGTGRPIAVPMARAGTPIEVQKSCGDVTTAPVTPYRRLESP